MKSKAVVVMLERNLYNSQYDPCCATYAVHAAQRAYWP